MDMFIEIVNNSNISIVNDIAKTIATEILDCNLAI